MLSQGHNEQAEEVARAAVRILERGGRASLLGEALTTHGIALARLQLYDHARLTLYRAIEVAHQSGALKDAGLAALTLLEELGERLDAEDTQAIFGRAYDWLGSSQHEETLRRLLRVSTRVMNLEHEGTKQELETQSTLKESIRHYEGKLIKQALHRAGGSVTQAARLLGVTRQALAYLLEHRHRTLLSERTPAIRRKRR